MPAKANQKALVELIKQVSGQANIITIPRVYISLTGDIKAALVLSQMVYWSDRSNLNDGWFYKTYSEWTAETGLTKREMRRILQLLSPFVTTQLWKRNTAPVLHYQVNIEALADAIQLLCTGLLPNVTIDSDDSSQSKVTKGHNRLLPKVTIDSDKMSPSSIRHRLPTETTTEITSSSLPPHESDAVQEEEVFKNLDSRFVKVLLDLGIQPDSLPIIDRCGWTQQQIREQIRYCQAKGKDPAGLLYYRLTHLKPPVVIIGYTHLQPDRSDQPESEPTPDVLDAWRYAASVVFADLSMPERMNWINSIEPVDCQGGVLYLQAHPYTWQNFITPNLDELLACMQDTDITAISNAEEVHVD